MEVLGHLDRLTLFLKFVMIFLVRGITCISADYRIALKHNSKVKDSMDDARAAYQWIISNAEDLNIDPDNIFVGGFIRWSISSIVSNDT